MPFGNRKKYFRESFQFSIVTMQKISPPWKPKIQLFSHFPKLKIAYFNGKKILLISLKLNTPNTLGCYGLNERKYTYNPRAGNELFKPHFVFIAADGGPIGFSVPSLEESSRLIYVKRSDPFKARRRGKHVRVRSRGGAGLLARRRSQPPPPSERKGPNWAGSGQLPRRDAL